MNPFRTLTNDLIAGACFLLSAMGALAGEKVDFNNEVQPILSEYCYHCHGPDRATREPKEEPLRLDRPEDAFAIRELIGEPVILKGQGEKSELYYRITSEDKTEVMPPRKAHKKMKPEEIEVLKRWIDEGAEYKEHWSFVSPVRPELPALSDLSQQWVRNGIDHFVAAKLEEKGLTPNKEQEGARLARRISLDLTGLPPADEKIAAWRENPDAIVEEVLGTDAYAEHFARHWLDAVRYADTHGIHKDNYRSIWPYRDWVIGAFKENMRFDQFTKEQIAGDLLPDPTMNQKIASGFNRCLATTGEGGAIAEEWQAIYAQDRVDTMGAIWLGLTTGCAACHDHKFDPISTRDNYALTAFFRNSSMSGLDQNRADHPPNLFVPAKDDQEEWRKVELDLVAKKKAVAQRRKVGEGNFREWLESAKEEEVSVDHSGLSLHLPLNDDGESLVAWTPDGLERWPAKGLKWREGPFGKAPLLKGREVALGREVGVIDYQDEVTLSAHVYVEGRPGGALIAKMDNRNGKNYRGWDLWLEDGKIGSHFIDTWDQKAFKTVSNTRLPEKKWTHVAVTYKVGRAKRKRIEIFFDGQLVASKWQRDGVGKTFLNEVPLRLGGREEGSGIGRGVAALQEFRIYQRVLAQEEIALLGGASVALEALNLAEEKRTPQQVKGLRDYYFGQVDEESLRLASEQVSLQKDQEKMRKRGAMTLVMDEKKGQQAHAYVLTRGDYRQKGEKVTPEVPEWVLPMPEGAPMNRLGLVEWLVDPDNPLPARVTVNRMWYYFFGQGLVKTTEDFGIMGARPTHPELLDWLAVEFVESGWDLQHVMRLIVDSATYRQSGQVKKWHLEEDPENKLLARGPRYRMDAEQIRDLALLASGLLVEEVGGPSVKPYQPQGVWEAVAMKTSNTKTYQQDKGEKLYRRSLYTFVKRAAPPASLGIFDAPSREDFCVRRERTNTPLQAFVLMNDPQFVEASRVLAERVLKEEVDFEGRLGRIYLALLGREPRSEEVEIVKESLEAMTQGFQEESERAQQLLEVGASPRDESLPAAELAGWTMVVTQLLNLDETITK